MRSVAGVEFTELPDAEECCGFGGTFSFKNPDVSAAMAEEKIGNITATGAQVCTGGDVSCLMHLGGAISRTGAGVATVHFAEILASTRQNPLEVTGPVELSIPGPTGRRRQLRAAAGSASSDAPAAVAADSGESR